MKKFKTLFLLMCLFLPFVFVGCENENQNSLSMPTDLTVKDGKIIFSMVEDADYYVISINDIEFTVDARFSNSVELIDNKINYDANKIFTLGESYSVKVKAISDEKADSSFTAPYSYQHTVKISKPQNVQFNETVLTWDVVENASFYKVKVVTPYDTVLFDEDGNVISGDDSESIAKAEISEYSFSTNHFEFDTLLTKAGNYNFYINAVRSDASTYTESGFTNKITYKHVVQLDEPANSFITKVNGEIQLSTVLDENANAIYIECGAYHNTLELNGSHESITKENNLINVNLNKFFKNVLYEDKQLDLSKLGEFSFKVQAVYQTANSEQRFYLDSSLTEEIAFKNIQKLSTPEISLALDEENAGYLLSITPNMEELNLMNGYNVMLATVDGIKTYALEQGVHSMLITEEFDSVFVQSIGIGNYLSSSLVSASKDSLTEVLEDLKISANGLTLSWDEVDNATYIIESNDEIYIQTENSFTLKVDDLTSNTLDFKLTTIVPNHKPLIQTWEIEVSPKLNTPSFGDNQGFEGKKLYVLTFTGSENAIGYYVYIKGQNSAEFIKIEKLFTSTTIDLTQYVSTNNEYTNYEVKVQAVASEFGVYEDSDLSEAISVSHVKVLSVPNFYKVNGVDAPIVKQVIAGTTHYILNFYGVADADGYEILINYNKKEISTISAGYQGLYQVDITSYLSSANNYEIKVRAISNEGNENVKSSGYNVFNYVLTRQLEMVTGINYSENNGTYTLSFNPVNNASAYRIRILKLNDSSYAELLQEKNLTNTFEVAGSADITDYVSWGGEYYIYVTALASKNGYFGDSDESATYAVISKLQTLSTPTNLSFSNNSETSFVLAWEGDDNADYYLIKLVDPFGVSYELKSYTESININEYITIQGDYTATVRSMIESNSTNSTEYESSDEEIKEITYLMNLEHDCLRNSIWYYGEKYNYAVSNVSQLKSLLWYHYVYGVDYGLNNGASLVVNLKLNSITDEDTGEVRNETIREAIVRIADEANDLDIGLYDFSMDETWLELVAEPTTSENALFSHLCKKLLSVYPELHVLDDNFEIDHTTGTIFKLKYSNTLNGEKIKADEKLVYTSTDYGNDYNYLDSSSRRSESSVFAIDKLSTSMRVTTTEQLLIALQNGMKPEFVGDCDVAKTVYNNAKSVLRLIVNDKMTDLEKTTAIFDWISASYNLNYYSDKQIKNSTNVVDADVSVYGKYAWFYLEGIFYDIEFDENGEILSLGSRLATSESYSKAFTLLCSIEGIDSIIVKGSYNYSSGNELISKAHTWNKVCVSTTSNDADKNWFNVDLTFSDNRIYFADVKKNYEISAHTYFLVTDEFIGTNQNGVVMKNDLLLISNEFKNNHSSSIYYDYYANSTFKMAKAEIKAVSLNLVDSSTTGFTYAKRYYTGEEITYQGYPKTTGYGKLENYILNMLISTYKTAKENNSQKARFEFRYTSNELSDGILTRMTIQNILSTASLYGLNMDLLTDANNDMYTIKNDLGNLVTTTVVFAVSLK